MVNINKLRDTKGSLTGENVFVTFSTTVNDNELILLRVDRNENEAKDLVKVIAGQDWPEYRDVFYIRSMFV